MRVTRQNKRGAQAIIQPEHIQPSDWHQDRCSICGELRNVYRDRDDELCWRCAQDIRGSIGEAGPRRKAKSA